MSSWPGQVCQVNIAACREPAGVEPFRVGVNVAELDKVLHSDIAQVPNHFEDGFAFRQTKGKLHFRLIAANTMLHCHTLRAQINSLKTGIPHDLCTDSCAPYL